MRQRVAQVVWVLSVIGIGTGFINLDYFLGNASQGIEGYYGLLKWVPSLNPLTYTILVAMVVAMLVATFFINSVTE